MNVEEAKKNLKAYIELVIEKNYCDCNELNIISCGKYADGSKNVAEAIETILNELEMKEDQIEFIKNEYGNTIEEKDKVIEELKCTLAENLAREINSTIKSSKKAKEDLEMLDEGWKLELEKKDKVIEEILKMWKQDDIRSVEELKEYFYEKAEQN